MKPKKVKRQAQPRRVADRIERQLLLQASTKLDERLELIRRLQAALDTAETGDALVQVARDANAAERELAALRRSADDATPDEGEAFEVMQRRVAAAGRVL